MSAVIHFQKSAFLDTNVLHYVSLYLDYAESNSLFPWNGKQEDASEHLRELSGPSSATESMRTGLAILGHASEQRLDLKYSEIAQLELLTGRVRGKGVLHAANEGLPDRMWSRLDEEEIRQRVTSEEMRSTTDGVDRIGSILEQFDFAEKTTNRQQFPEVLELAYSIESMIYMDVADSIVFASTILSGADYLFTSDNPFKKTVNRIQNPGSAGDADLVQRFRDVRGQLDRIRGQEGPGNGPLWPTAHSVTASGTWNPGFA